MEFQSSKIKQEDNKASPVSFKFLLEPPDCSVSLQEFEDYAVARLKLLRIFERVSLTSGAKDGMEWKRKIDNEIKDAGVTMFQYKASDESDDIFHKDEGDDYLRFQHYDHISHYILRLAFCRTEELRRWFVNMEVEFFRYKFASTADGNLAKDILEAHFKDVIQKYEGDRTPMLEDLKDTYYYINAGDIEKADIYEVPFINCLELVKTRKVHLQNGKAYIFHAQLQTIVCSEFRRILSRDLATMSKVMHLVDEDERLEKILQDFDKRHTGNSYAVKNGASNDVVTVETLEQSSTTSFPLCMKSLYDHVKKEYHLKHFGRLQLGLFFKGLGLPMEEAARFWRTYFTKKTGVDDTRFDKQYLYNIRHMYGREGKRADYTPYSCMKIITSSVAPGEHHGCPFRHSDVTPLKVKFVEAGLSATGVKEIMDLVEKHHYQIACQRYFELTHNKATLDGGLNHPNQYYEESQKVLSGNFKIKTEPKYTTNRVKVYNDNATIKDDKADEEVIKMDEDDILKALDDDPTDDVRMEEGNTASSDPEK